MGSEEAKHPYTKTENTASGMDWDEFPNPYHEIDFKHRDHVVRSTCNFPVIFNRSANHVGEDQPPKTTSLDDDPSDLSRKPTKGLHRPQEMVDWSLAPRERFLEVLLQLHRGEDWCFM